MSRADRLSVLVGKRKGVVAGCNGGVGIVLQWEVLQSRLPGPEPMVLKLHPSPRLTEGPERVNIPISGAVPAAKLDSQLECRPGLAHKVRLVDPEHVVEHFDVRERGLPDADRSNLVGFNKRNRVVLGRELVPD